MAKILKKGSITIFLALILSLILSLVCASIESVRMAAARTQILNSMDIGLYSLFGQYDRTLLKDYDLFALYAGGKEELDMASVYDNFQSYMKPVLKQNSQKLNLLQGGLNGYQLLTDGNGEVFYQQAVKNMRETLESQGVQILLGKLRDQQKKTDEAEKKGQQAENGGSLKSYDSEIADAAKKSEEAEKEQQNQIDSGEFGDGGSVDDFTGGVNTEVENPIPVIRKVRKMGLLDIVIPTEKGISDAFVNKKELASGRKLQTGMEMNTNLQYDNSYTSGILFGQYLLSKLGNYTRPASSGLRYQVEYILGGKNSDRENLKSVATKLLLIRQGVNMAYLVSDGGKRIQIEALSLAVASSFLIPPAAVVIEAALMFCWAFAESILDVRELFAGGHVPLVKTAAGWQLSLKNLSGILNSLDSERKDSRGGMSYEDYLQVMLMAKGKQHKVTRGMDMIECTIRDKGNRPKFRMDHCIVALEASADVKANKKKTFTVIRQYAYE